MAMWLVPYSSHFMIYAIMGSLALVRSNASYLSLRSFQFLIPRLTSPVGQHPQILEHLVTSCCQLPWIIQRFYVKLR